MNKLYKNTKAYENTYTCTIYEGCSAPTILSIIEKRKEGRKEEEKLEGKDKENAKQFLDHQKRNKLMIIIQPLKMKYS
jgi:hypothetical protein